VLHDRRSCDHHHRVASTCRRKAIAYIDATAVAVFAYQHADGTYVVDICMRDDIPEEGPRLLLDGGPLMRSDCVIG
jgi:hypothetical protein